MAVLVRSKISLSTRDDQGLTTQISGDRNLKLLLATRCPILHSQEKYASLRGTPADRL